MQKVLLTEWSDCWLHWWKVQLNCQWRQILNTLWNLLVTPVTPAIRTMHSFLKISENVLLHLWHLLQNGIFSSWTCLNMSCCSCGICGKNGIFILKIFETCPVTSVASVGRRYVCFPAIWKYKLFLLHLWHLWQIWGCLETLAWLRIN